jgi:hypothetical protein
MWKTRDVSMCDFFVLKYFQNFKYRGDKRVVFFFFFFNYYLAKLQEGATRVLLFYLAVIMAAHAR